MPISTQSGCALGGAAPTTAAILFDPGCAIAGTRPKDGKEAFVERRIACALVATINITARPFAEAYVCRQHVHTNRPSHPIFCRVGGRTMPDLATVKDAGSGGYLDKHWGRRIEARMFGRCRHVRPVVRLAVEVLGQGSERPFVGAGSVFKRTGIAMRFVECYPTGYCRRWVEEVHERRILVIRDRLSRGRVPPNRVLSESHPVPAAQVRGETA